MKPDIEIRRDDYLSGGIVYIKQYSSVVADKKIGNKQIYLHNDTSQLLSLERYKIGMHNRKEYRFNENGILLWHLDGTRITPSDY
jgi:hypothetical protein